MYSQNTTLSVFINQRAFSKGDQPDLPCESSELPQVPCPPLLWSFSFSLLSQLSHCTSCIWFRPRGQSALSIRCTDPSSYGYASYDCQEDDAKYDLADCHYISLLDSDSIIAVSTFLSLTRSNVPTATDPPNQTLIIADRPCTQGFPGKGKLRPTATPMRNSCQNRVDKRNAHFGFVSILFY